MIFAACLRQGQVKPVSIFLKSDCSHLLPCGPEEACRNAWVSILPMTRLRQ